MDGKKEVKCRSKTVTFKCYDDDIYYQDVEDGLKQLELTIEKSTLQAICKKYQYRPGIHFAYRYKLNDFKSIWFDVEDEIKKSKKAEQIKQQHQRQLEKQKLQKEFKEKKQKQIFEDNKKIEQKKRQQLQKIMNVRKWFTSSGGQPGPHMMNGKQCMKWNSGGFAPAWIEVQFQKQFISCLNLIPNMTPASGQVAYHIAVDGAHYCSLNQVLKCYVLKTININKQCCKIRITTTSSPSWVAWFDVDAQKKQ